MAYYQNFDHFFNQCNKMIRSKNVKCDQKELKQICRGVFSKKDNHSLATIFYFTLKEDCENPDFDLKETLKHALDEKGVKANVRLAEILQKDYKQNDEVVKMLATLPCRSGLYFLYDNHFKLKYIGKSIDLFNRIFSSASEKRLYNFKYCIIENIADLHILEIYAINLYKPERNRDCLASEYPSFELKLPELSEMHSFYINA
jgi:hypothetical protein